MKRGKEIIDELLKRKKNVIGILKEMRTLTTVSLETAFAALLTQDKSLANKAIKLVEELEFLQYQLEIETMLAASNPKEALRMAGIYRVGASLANIADSVREICDPLLRDIPVEKTIVDAFLELGTIKIIEVKENSKVMNKTIRDVEETGVRVIGIKKGNEWMMRPELSLTIEKDMTLVLSGPKTLLTKIK